MPVRTRESEMGFGGRGTRLASELIRPSRRTRARGWMGQGHLSRGGTRWREREGKKGTSEPGEAIKAEGTRSKNGHGRCDSRM